MNKNVFNKCLKLLSVRSGARKCSGLGLGLLRIVVYKLLQKVTKCGSITWLKLTNGVPLRPVPHFTVSHYCYRNYTYCIVTVDWTDRIFLRLLWNNTTTTNSSKAQLSITVPSLTSHCPLNSLSCRNPKPSTSLQFFKTAQQRMQFSEMTAYLTILRISWTQKRNSWVLESIYWFLQMLNCQALNNQMLIKRINVLKTASFRKWIEK